MVQWLGKKVKVLVAQSCPTLRNPLDGPTRLLCHGIVQAEILEWGAIFFSRGPSPPRD